MIRSTHGKIIKAVIAGRNPRGLQPDLVRRAERKIAQIDAAKILDDLRVPPSNRLEALHGDGKGQHSIRINRQWRICFRWDEGDATDVEIVDYH